MLYSQITKANNKITQHFSTMNIQLFVLALIMVVARANMMSKSHENDNVEANTVLLDDSGHENKLPYLVEAGKMLRGGIDNLSDCNGDECCDCDYRSGGCFISTPPPPGILCRCLYKDWWSCEGQPVRDCNSHSYGDVRECCAADASSSLRSSEKCCAAAIGNYNGDCDGY